MKKLELAFAAILVPLDYLALLLAGTLAYLLRFESFVTEIRPVVFELSYESFFKILAVAALAWLAVFAVSGLYSIKRQSFFANFFKIFIACSAATLIIVVAFFFNFQLFSSRLIIITSWLLSVVIVTAERLIVFYVKKLFYKKGLGLRQVVIIGANKNAAEINKSFTDNPGHGFKIMASYPFFDQETKMSLEVLAKQEKLDDLILADPGLDNIQKNDLVNFCTEHQLNYKYVASLLDTKLINFDLSTISGIPLIEVRPTRLDGWGRILKRLVDLLLSVAGLIILSPIFLVLAILVKLTSSGPVFVALERIGCSGKLFKLYKFRSMIKNAQALKNQLKDYNQRADGPLFKMADDPRLTSFGKVIRKWSLDELPQLVNVCLGQMSLVGPRPHEPEEVKNYQGAEKKLLAIKPGITGMAQVSGRSDLLWEDEVGLDTYYVENWSLGLDLQIMLRTPKAVFSRRQSV
ncbi:MAG: sugar transferase [Patescibacteria group bacterium]|jgi:exopolysaccharide biosynthesis polyprenyl glycosylphosphotransferase